MVSDRWVRLVTHPIDPAAPLRSLRSAAGIGGIPLSPTEMARARGIAPQSIYKAEQTGGRMSIETFAAFVTSLGGTLEIRVTLPR